MMWVAGCSYTVFNTWGSSKRRSKENRTKEADQYRWPIVANRLFDGRGQFPMAAESTKQQRREKGRIEPEK